MSKKIAIFHPYLNIRGGAERKLLFICQKLIENHFNVELFVFRFDKEKTFHEIIPSQLKITEIRSFHKLIWVLKIFFRIKKGEFDLLIASNYPANLPLILYKRFSPKKKTVWICNEVIPLLRARTSLSMKCLFYFEKKFAHSIDSIIANSKNTARSIQQHYGISSKVIRSGIELPKELEAKELREKVHSLSKHPYVLILSRIEEHKNIQLIPKLCKRFPNIKVVVAGRGDAMHQVETFSSNFENLNFLGGVTQKEKMFLYKHCFLFAFLPKEEPLGVTMMEALSFNRPVVAFNKGGPLEVVQDRGEWFSL